MKIRVLSAEMGEDVSEPYTYRVEMDEEINFLLLEVLTVAIANEKDPKRTEKLWEVFLAL